MAASACRGGGPGQLGNKEQESGSEREVNVNRRQLHYCLQPRGC
jgi:hypothetical protein